MQCVSQDMCSSMLSSENASSGRLQEVKNNGLSLAVRPKKTVSMGLTDRRKTAKNLVDSRKS